MTHWPAGEGLTEDGFVSGFMRALEPDGRKRRGALALA